MAVAYDAFSRPGSGTGLSGDQSWTHTPVGTPRGVVVWVLYGASSPTTDHVNGVTYGGVTMVEVSVSPVNKTTGTDNLQVHCFALFASVSSGAQTVAVDTDGNAASWAGGCISVTAGADVEIVDVEAISSDAAADPSTTLSLGGRECFCAIGFASGQNAATSIAPLSGWTLRSEEDTGGQTEGIYTYDTIGTLDVTAGWTQTTEDAAAIAIALAEVAGAPAGQPTVKRWGGVAHMGTTKLPGGTRGGSWGLTRDHIIVPRRFAA